ncbi:MAPEG family protein [Gymnodinialimonas hymeniacidonis]|uniref:MAPEG family protein n=1 Tax=Gymnodinialimonas hymeniacidonis TaxID=3126508 RepID=UPI0034C646FC
MSPELTVLALAGLLQVLQFALMAIPANLEVGTGKTLSPRDKGRSGGSIEEQVSPRTGRLIRAMNNHFEALILFTIAVFVVTLGDQSSPLTATCAWIYLAARVLYVPAYAFGWVPWRSFIWFAGFLATLAMLLAALFG